MPYTVEVTYINKTLLLSGKPTADLAEADITEGTIRPILKQMSDTELQTAKAKAQERLNNALRVAEDLYTIYLKLKEVREVMGYDAFNAVSELRQMATASEHYYNKYKDLHRREEELIKKSIDEEAAARTS